MKRKLAGHGAMAKAAACRFLSTAEIARCLTACDSVRTRTLFTLGLVAGFRISGLLSVTVGDARTALETGYLHLSAAGGKGRARAHKIALNRDGLFAIGAQVDSLGALGEPDRMALDAPLFQSRKRETNGKPGCLRRAQATRDLKEVFAAAGIAGMMTPGLTGSHVLRKTWTMRTKASLEAAGLGSIDALEALRVLGGWKWISSVQAYLPTNEKLESIMLAGSALPVAG